MKKFACLLLGIILSLSMAGCGGGDKDNGFSEEKTVQLFGFNTAVEFTSFWRRQFIGKAELNTDKKYITEGTGSAKITIDYPARPGNHWTTHDIDVLPKITFDSLTDYMELTDIKGVKKLSADWYNPNNYEITVAFYIVNGSNEIVANELYKLRPDAWTTVTLPLNWYAIEDGKYSDIAQYCFALTHELIREGTMVYLDNFRAVVTEEEPPLLTVDFDDETKFLTLDDYNQMQYIRPYNTFTMPMSSISLSSGPKESTAALKVELFPMHEANFLAGTYYYPNRQKAGFELVPSYCELVKWELLRYSDTPVICVDIFNATAHDDYVYLSIGDGTKEVTLRADLPAGQWTTVTSTDLSGLDYGKIKFARVYFDTFNLTDSRIYYVRNMQIEL